MERRLAGLARTPLSPMLVQIDQGGVTGMSGEYVSDQHDLRGDPDGRAEGSTPLRMSDRSFVQVPVPPPYPQTPHAKRAVSARRPNRRGARN